MVRAIVRVIGEKWWLIGAGILLGLVARALFGPGQPDTGWHYQDDLPAIRPADEGEFDFPLTNRNSEN